MLHLIQASIPDHIENHLVLLFFSIQTRIPIHTYQDIRTHHNHVGTPTPLKSAATRAAPGHPDPSPDRSAHGLRNPDRHLCPGASCPRDPTPAGCASALRSPRPVGRVRHRQRGPGPEAIESVLHIPPYSPSRRIIRRVLV